MTTPSHAEVLAAIDKARWSYDMTLGFDIDGIVNRNDHCDDLRATAEIHAPVYKVRNVATSLAPVYTEVCGECTKFWPCHTVNQVVIDRLKGWGVL